MRFPFQSNHAPIGVVVANGDGTYGYLALAGVANADGITASLAVSGGSSGGGGSTGSVTAAGTNGTLAQAVQGINGGVPLPISGTVAVTDSTPLQVYGSVTTSGTVSVSNFPASQPVTGTFFQTTQPVSTAYTTQQVGTWNYYAVAGGGTVTVGSGQRVIGIAAHSTAGGSFTINGGATVTVPANSSIEIQPIGNVTAPTIVFSSGIDAAFVETVM
jgi:hypothetical protein